MPVICWCYNEFMIWIVIAIIIGSVLIARAIRGSQPVYYPIQNPSDPNYRLAYTITDDYLDHLNMFILQSQLANSWQQATINSQDHNEKAANTKNAEESNEVLRSMNDEFWAKYGGYNRMLDPNVVPMAVWPPELVQKYHARIAEFEDINQSVSV